MHAIAKNTAALYNPVKSVALIKVIKEKNADISIQTDLYLVLLPYILLTSSLGKQHSEKRQS